MPKLGLCQVALDPRSTACFQVPYLMSDLVGIFNYIPCIQIDRQFSTWMDADRSPLVEQEWNICWDTAWRPRETLIVIAQVSEKYHNCHVGALPIQSCQGERTPDNCWRGRLLHLAGGGVKGLSGELRAFFPPTRRADFQAANHRHMSKCSLQRIVA